MMHDWNKYQKQLLATIGDIAKLSPEIVRGYRELSGAGILSTFRQLGLINEYRLIVNPVVLGKGNPLFKGMEDKLHLKLLRTKVFRSSGNVLLCYQPERTVRRTS